MKARRSTAYAREVVPAPTRLVRRSLEMMHGSVIGGRYRVLGAIGTGGMGSVYEGLDLQTGCTVALKALQPGSQSPAQLKRLRREAAAATQVKNNHVCQVHYLGVERGTPFIVMERLHGDTLRTRLNEEGALPIGDAVAIVCQLLDALTAAHDVGVIHRDVKPGNVFLTSARDEEPKVKLIDFGIATMTRGMEGNDFANDVTSTEEIAGTLGYLAPEQLLSVGDIDVRVDVYSAGVTFYEMLSGQRAYAGSYAEIVHDIVLGEPPKVTHLRSDVNPLFDDVLAMAMAKSRDRRFASAQAFKRAVMAAWRASLGISSSGVVPKVSSEMLDELAIDVDVDIDFGDVTEAADEDEDDVKTLRPPPGVGRFGDETLSAADADLDDIPTLPPPPFMSRGSR